MDRTFMTRSIQLQGVKRAVGGIVQTKERLSQESLNSRTREYMLVKRLGQLFFERLRGSDARMRAGKSGCFTG
jgi:hypothetical protein